MPALLSPVLALLLGSAVLSVGANLQTVLLPVRAAVEGFPTAMIGVIGSAYSAGFAAGCLLVPGLVRRLGHAGGFAALAVVGAAAALAYTMTHWAEAWILIRAATGFCMAGLSMVVESWVNANAANASRGRSLAVFAIVAAVAGTAGQMLLSLADPAGSLLFVGIALCLLLSAVPVAMARGTPGRPMAMSLKRLYTVSPVGLVGCLFIGLANGAFWQLAPVFARERGLSTTGIALFMSVVVLSGALAQWPVGKLADRMDRRRVIVGALLAGIAADLLMMRAAPGLLGELLAVGVFGACVLPVYSLCVAHTNDFLGRQHCVAASGGLLLAFGLGAIVGPVAAAALMQSFGPGALFAYAAAVHAAFVVFTLYRMRKRPLDLATRGSLRPA